MDRDLEAEHLLIAERHIVEGQARIDEQEELIARLRRQGHDITEAGRFLMLLQETLGGWYGHRDLIAASLARGGGPVSAPD